MTNTSINKESTSVMGFNEYVTVGTILTPKLDGSLQDCTQDVIQEIICAQEKKLDQLQKANQDLLADNKALREALAPFANASFYWGAFSDFQQVTTEGIRVEHLRKAKKVLE